MVYSLNYKRPAYVDNASRNSFQTEKSTADESVSSRSSCPYGIPDALSFEKIVSGGTCPVSSRSMFPLLNTPREQRSTQFAKSLG